MEIKDMRWCPTLKTDPATQDLIVRMYEDGVSHPKLAKEFEKSETTVWRILTYNNVQMRDNSKEVDEDLLVKLYVDEQKSLRETAAILNIEKKAVRKRLIDLGYNIRPRKWYGFPPNRLCMTE